MIKTIIKIIILTLGYRIFGFFRDILIATNFGSGTITDSFFLAQSLPNLILEIFAVGAFSSAMVPVIINKKIKIHEILGNFLSIFLIIAILGMIFSKDIIVFLAPGFKEKEILLSSEIAKIFLLSIPFMIFNEINSVLLISESKAQKITESNLINNLIVVLISILLMKNFGIKAFSYSIFLGILFKGGYLFYNNKQNLTLFKIKINLKNEEFIVILKLMFPIMIASIGAQINFIVDRKIASSFSNGGISILNYANKIIQLPLGVVLGAVILSSFPLVIKSIKNNNKTLFQKLVQEKIEIILITMLFISIYIFIYSEIIIEIIYKRGNFTIENVKETSLTLKYYVFSILWISFTTIFQKIFHAYQKTKITAWISIIGVLINISLNTILSKALGLKGLALATTISNFIVCIILFLFLKKEKKIYFNSIKTTKIVFANVTIGLLNIIIFNKIFFTRNLFLCISFNFILNGIVYGYLILNIYKVNLKKIVIFIKNRRRIKNV